MISLFFISAIIVACVDLFMGYVDASKKRNLS